MPKQKYCIGIDLGGTSAKLGIFNISGMLVDKWEIPTNKGNCGLCIIPELANEVVNKLTGLQIDISEVKGIGIGVPGTVLPDGCVTVSVNLGWRNILVAEEFRRVLPIPVLVENDANVAAMGEMWQGSAQGYKNLIMITIGTGIGGGVVVNGRIASGLHGGAGEFGHIPIVFNEEEVCKCGRKGCLELAGSATGILNYTKELLNSSMEASSLRLEAQLSVLKIFDAAKAGDNLALKAVNRAGKFLGIAMAVIAGSLDPEVFILGGGVSKAGEFFISIIKKYYRENVLYTLKDTEIRQALLGNDAGIYGAARLVLD